MLSPFQWIRNMARAAVNAGVMDGLRDVTPEDEQPPSGLGNLADRLNQASSIPALPAAEPKKQTKGK